MTTRNDPTRAAQLLQLLLLAIAAWSAMYARFALGPLQEALQSTLALSDTEIAWLQGAAISVPMMLFAIPGGLLVDRLPRARFFLIFALLNVLSTAALAYASTFALLIAARCFAGVAVGAMVVGAYATVADLYPPAQRGRATMVVSIGETVGSPAAFALGGTLLAMSGTDEGWRETLLWMCAPLLPVVLSMFMLREPPRIAASAKNPPLREIAPQLWKYRSLIGTLLLARIMVWMADGAVLVWAAPAFARGLALPPERVGALIATALLVAGLSGPIVGGALADFSLRRGGPRRTMTVLSVLALLCVPAALFALAPTAAAAGAALTLFLAFGFTISTAALTVGTVVIPPELRGVYVATTMVAGSVCFGLAPLLVSSLSSVLGGSTVIGQALALVCGVTSGIGALVFGFGSRKFPSSVDQRL